MTTRRTHRCDRVPSFAIGLVRSERQRLAQRNPETAAQVGGWKAIMISRLSASETAREARGNLLLLLDNPIET
jgi:hypothetical protein